MVGSTTPCIVQVACMGMGRSLVQFSLVSIANQLHSQSQCEREQPASQRSAAQRMNQSVPLYFMHASIPPSFLTSSRWRWCEPGTCFTTRRSSGCVVVEINEGWAAACCIRIPPPKSLTKGLDAALLLLGRVGGPAVVAPEEQHGALRGLQERHRLLLCQVDGRRRRQPLWTVWVGGWMDGWMEFDQASQPCKTGREVT